MQKQLKELEPGAGFILNGQHYMVVRTDGLYINRNAVESIVLDKDAMLALAIDEDFQIRDFHSATVVETTEMSEEASMINLEALTEHLDNVLTSKGASSDNVVPIHDGLNQIAELDYGLQLPAAVPENILMIIGAIRNSRTDSVVAYTSGSCFHFYNILKCIFPQAVAYYDSDHVITEINGRFYDITGEVEKTINHIRMDTNPQWMIDGLTWIYAPYSERPDTLEALAAATQRIRELENQPELAIKPQKFRDIFALAYRCLWMAYVWNDHNFDSNLRKYAVEEAERLGIKSFDDANDWLDSLEKVEYGFLQDFKTNILAKIEALDVSQIEMYIRNKIAGIIKEEIEKLGVDRNGR